MISAEKCCENQRINSITKLYYNLQICRQISLQWIEKESWIFLIVDAQWWYLLLQFDKKQMDFFFVCGKTTSSSISFNENWNF